MSEIRVSEIRGSKIRGSKIRVSEIRISSNHRELHGAIFCFPFSLADIYVMQGVSCVLCVVLAIVFSPAQHEYLNFLPPSVWYLVVASPFAQGATQDASTFATQRPLTCAEMWRTTLPVRKGDEIFVVRELFCLNCLAI